MLGAIVGDVVGSRFEWNNIKTKNFDLFTQECDFTDDTVMSVAVCHAFLETKVKNYEGLQAKTVETMQYLGRMYKYRGYGSHFHKWLSKDNPQPYNSYGNGAAMRVSACGYVGQTLEEVKAFSKTVTEISHNHQEGLKGAEATAVAVYMARLGLDKKVIKDYVVEHYYPIDFTIDKIRSEYRFDGSCQGSVPYALQAFFESNDFEDTIRTIMSIGGDSDTLGAIAGAVAGAYYGVPEDIRLKTIQFLDKNMRTVIEKFEKAYCIR